MNGRRWILAAALASVAGVVLLQLHDTLVEAIGAILLGAVLAGSIGLIVARLGPQSQPDREREAAAREHFERTGRWPDEEERLPPQPRVDASAARASADVAGSDV